MNVRTYCRWSPRPRPKNGKEWVDPNEKQERLIVEYCAKHKWQIVSRHSDSDASGGDPERDGLSEAVEACRRGEILLAYKFDRIARDALTILNVNRDLKAKGAVLASVVEGEFDSDPLRKFSSTVFAAFDEMIRQQAAERTSRVMRRKQAEGWRMSKIPPYGKKIDPFDPKRLVDNPEEQANIELILELSRHVPPKGPRTIARIMNKERIPLRGDSFMAWNPTIVASIIRRAEATAQRT